MYPHTICACSSRYASKISTHYIERFESMKILDGIKNSEKSVKIAANLLVKGEIVALPTETVYGLAANALDENAVAKIFAAKGRPQDNPLIVHISSVEMAKSIAIFDERAKALAEKFWPGPLTLILKSREIVTVNVTAGLNSVAVRIPNCKIFQDVINAANMPLAAPSANISGRPSATSAIHVAQDFDNKISAVIDGGECKIGIESTVLSLVDVPTILRPGKITKAQIESVIGKIEIAQSTENISKKPISPGTKYKHYAPKIPLTAITASDEKFYKYVQNMPKNTAILCYNEDVKNLDGFECIALSSHKNCDDYAKNLYATLRKLDELGAKSAIIRMVDGDLALQNRVEKACGGNIIEI